MSKQQTKRRRKRYEPGSAYAGDVKPGGVFSLLGDVRIIRAVFIVMAVALVGGLFGAKLGRFGLGGSTNPPPNFVLPPKATGTGTPGASGTPIEVRQYSKAPAMTIDTSRTYTATISTELGDIQVELLPSQAPTTVNNFVFLARDGFYDGLTFHQVTQGFDAQAGDPACEAVSVTCSGAGGPGYDLSQEKPGPFDAGTVGMANASQFFIALSNSSQFAQYTPFGRVTSGLNIAEQLTQGTEITKITISEG
jgi:cyclophilin family peptidyl-prolyl cis-trans isomerase